MRMMSVAGFACVCVCMFSAAQGLNCPHEDTTLTKFSDRFSNYDKQTDIIIAEGILLDIPTLHVNTIEIIGTGKLVFNQSLDIEIKVNGILVKDDASLIIGSELCRHNDNVRIVLQGTRTADRSTLTGAGEKYIAVTDRGTLHIYGEDKLAWTKLTETIPLQAYANDNVYWHKVSPNQNYRRWYKGLSLYIFDSALQMKFYYVYGIIKSNSAEEMAIVNEMINKLEGVSEGDLVAISVHNYLNHKKETDLSGLYDKIEHTAGMQTGSLLLRNSTMYDAFTLIFVKGGTYRQDHSVILQYQSPGRAIASLEYKGQKVTSESVVSYRKSHLSSIDLRILSPEVGYPEIQVLDDVTSWEAGDKILITSTDYVWHHAEVRTIREIAGTHTIKLEDELTFRHFGEIESEVDMRAEVALLSRNIKIEGEMSRDCPPSNGNCGSIPYDTYGGHIKIIQNFNSVVIDGAELEHMGQRTDMGFYPIHFHMCLDVTGKQALVRRNSIHDSLSRAVAVQGTYGTSTSQPGVEVIENVAYRIHGHAYFLEDGIERATRLEGNLVAGVLNVPGYFVSDLMFASGFWITTPQVDVIGNVAAGGSGFGFWYTFPDEGVGPSKGLVYQRYEARQSPLWTCDNNVAHSNTRAGMFFDNALFDNKGKAEGIPRYTPLKDPLDSKSETVKTQIVRLTVYKNLKINAWVRGCEIEVVQMSSAESKKGLQFAKGNTQSQTLKKSIFIGRSTLNGENETYPDAYLPRYLNHYLGAVVYDGPAFFESLWFTNFYNSPEDKFVAGAIGFQPLNKFSSPADSHVKDMRFSFEDLTGGNRVFDGTSDDEVFGFGNVNGDEGSAFRDIDGSVIRCPGDANLTGQVAVVKPEKFVLTENCKYRENWQMAICREKFGKLQYRLRAVFFVSTSSFSWATQTRRIRYDNTSDKAYEDHDGTGAATPAFTIVLGDNTYYYEQQYVSQFPRKVDIYANGVERDYPVVVGTCLPEGTTRADLTLITTGPDGYWLDANIAAADSMQGLSEDTKMNKYYMDGRMLYLRFQSKKTRNPDWDKFDNTMCAGKSCPKLTLTLKTNRPYTPCFEPTPEELSTDVYIDDLERIDCTYPSGQPDSDWGAGDTMMKARDGNWGEWSGWAECCNANGVVSQTTRYRLCDNPPKSESGADCPGAAQDSGPCDKPCPVDGVLTDWDEWSECMCDGRAEGSTGVKVLRRQCAGTANGGKYCNGYLEYYSSCNGGCEDIFVI